jgi:hypothetical protein
MWGLKFGLCNNSHFNKLFDLNELNFLKNSQSKGNDFA